MLPSLSIGKSGGYFGSAVPSPAPERFLKTKIQETLIRNTRLILQILQTLIRNYNACEHAWGGSYNLGHNSLGHLCPLVNVGSVCSIINVSWNCVHKYLFALDLLTTNLTLDGRTGVLDSCSSVQTKKKLTDSLKKVKLHLSCTENV